MVTNGNKNCIVLKCIHLHDGVAADPDGIFFSALCLAENVSRKPRQRFLQSVTNIKFNNMFLQLEMKHLLGLFSTQAMSCHADFFFC